MILTYSGKGQKPETLFLEQEPWPDGTGEVTRVDLLAAIAANIFNVGETKIFCGMNDDGSFTTAIHAYPADLNLVYRIGTTWGALSGRSVEQEVITEYVEFTGSDSDRLEYPAQAIISRDIFFNALDLQLGTIPTPALTFSGQNVSASVPCYATYEVKYRVTRHVYQLVIFPRELPANIDRSQASDMFGAVAWAAWEGGVAPLLSVQAPPGAVETYQTGATDCGSNGGGGSVAVESKGGETIEKSVDYCETYA